MAIPGSERPAGQFLEPDRVHDHAATGAQDDLVAAQHHRVRHAEGAPGEVRRLVQPRHRSAIVSSGQTRSITCSRCSRRSGASASTFTTAAAWRRFQLASATGTPPTVTANRPSSVM